MISNLKKKEQIKKGLNKLRTKHFGSAGRKHLILPYMNISSFTFGVFWLFLLCLFSFWGFVFQNVFSICSICTCLQSRSVLSPPWAQTEAEMKSRTCCKVAQGVNDTAGRIPGHWLPAPSLCWSSSLEHTLSYVTWRLGRQNHWTINPRFSVTLQPNI